MINAAVAGASGYAGAELVRILAGHDNVSLCHVGAASSSGKRVDELYPSLRGTVDLTYESISVEALCDADIVFLALPSGEAMQLVPQLLGNGQRVIDLSGDYRLPAPSEYPEFYHHIHTSPELLGKAVYGLPEVFPQEIADASLLANPGCYPTSALLALIPALQQNLIEPDGIIINALSGVSGAGRSTSVEMSFCEVNENIRAYKIGSHQHIPEIQTILQRTAGVDAPVTFIPHLVPLSRGIYSTIHARSVWGLNAEQLHEAYLQFYADAPFVRVTNRIPQLHDVVRTNFCDLHLVIEPRTGNVVIISAIDNLMKGAAGQAVQNMNLMFGFPQDTGLLKKENADVY